MSIDLSVDCTQEKYQADQGQPEGGGVVTPQNGTTIYLTATTASYSMSVDNTDDESFLTR